MNYKDGENIMSIVIKNKIYLAQKKNVVDGRGGGGGGREPANVWSKVQHPYH